MISWLSAALHHTQSDRLYIQYSSKEGGKNKMIFKLHLPHLFKMLHPLQQNIKNSERSMMRIMIKLHYQKQIGNCL